MVNFDKKQQRAARIWVHTILHISLERVLRWLYWKLSDPMKQRENSVV